MGRSFLLLREPSPLTIVNDSSAVSPAGATQDLAGRSGARRLSRNILQKANFARPSWLTAMQGDPVVCIVVVIGIGLFANTTAIATEVPGLSCSQIGSFARQVAVQKGEGRTPDDALNRLRDSIGAAYPTTERELEKIVQAIYGMPIFSTATPDEVGTAYQAACELGR